MQEMTWTTTKFPKHSVGPERGGERGRETERKRRKEWGGGCVWVGLFASRETGLRWFGGGLVWFGANMAGLRNKNAFKFILQVFILSQKHILGVKKVVWCGLDVVWGGLEVVWGGLGCFHGPVYLFLFESIKERVSLITTGYRRIPWYGRF